MGVDGEFIGELTIAENFHALELAANEAVGAEEVGGHRFSSRENVERFQIEHGVFLAERIVETALGHAAVQRHLAAFKSATARIAAAGLLAFVAGASGFAALGSHAPANA